MHQPDASQLAALAAIARIRAGIRITITDDISQYRETLEALLEGLEQGGITAVHDRYLLLKSLTPWIDDADDSESAYPEYEYFDVIDETDLRAIHEFRDDDFGEAYALIYLYHARLRFVVGERWFLWTGMRWARDNKRGIIQFGHMVSKIRLKAATMVFEESVGQGDAARDKALARMRYAHGRGNMPPIMRMLEAAATMPQIVLEPDQMDRDKFKMGVQNGVLDLINGVLVPPEPSMYITKRTDIPYFPDAPCSRWEQFLNEVFKGDDELIEYIQRFIGYALTGDTREQYIWFGYGVGSNGKGVFVEILLALMGDYGSPIDFKTIMSGGETEKGEDIAPLRGKRFIAASESEKGKRLNEALVKKMTGGDRVRVRHLYGEMFDFVPEWKIFAITNHKPVITGTDRGIWRRMRLIPFTASFEGAPDLELPKKLRAELPGILAWAVRGTRKWLEHGLGLPFTVAEATEGYRQEMDILGTFLTERTVKGPEHKIKLATLYDAYRAYMEEAGVDHPMTSFAFKRALEERGFQQGRNETERFWKGIILFSPSK